MLAEQLHDRHPRLLLALGELEEHRALLDLLAHVVAHEDQHERQQERHAPAPREERVAGGDQRHEREHAARQQQAQRHAELRGGAEEAPLGLGRVLDRHEHRAAPLSTGRDALEHPQEDQQHRGRDADDLVGGEHADQGGRGSHEDERQHEHDASAVLVAQVTGEERPQRAEQEAQAHREERQDLGDAGAGGREEELPEHQAGGRGVQEEVVPLDGGADHGGEDHPAAVRGCGDGAGGREAGRLGAGHGDSFGDVVVRPQWSSSATSSILPGGSLIVYDLRYDAREPS